jgi:L-lactate dehydrogenase (cytochrome)
MAEISIDDLRERARRRLPKMVFDFIDGGASDETTLRANRADFEALKLKPRMLVDVRHRDLSTTLMGKKLALPLVLAPTGLTGLATPKGELAAARAAKAAGIKYTLSTNATSSIEELAAEIREPFWFQLYLMNDRGLSQSLLERAKAAGCSAIVMTTDLQAHGRRERDLRNGFTVPPRIRLGNALEMLSRPGWMWRMATGPRITFANFKTEADEGFMELAKRTSTALDPGITWKEIGWVKSITGLPVLLKGILTGADARTGIEHGADGIIVSNHGGRQLDGVQSAIAALPEVADAVQGKVPVLLDGGVRRGADMIKARALGARACMIGRPFLYGLAALGPTGAARAIDILKAELDNTMALLGLSSFDAIDESVLVRERRWPSN